MTNFYVEVSYGHYNDPDYKKKITITLPDQFKKSDVEALVISNYSAYRTVYVKITEDRDNRPNILIVS